MSIWPESGSPIQPSSIKKREARMAGVQREFWLTASVTPASIASTGRCGGNTACL